MNKKRRVRPYNSLEELQMRKEQLTEIIELENDEIKRLWNILSKDDEEELSRGKQIMKYVKYGMMAYDGIMLFQKLKQNYGSVLNIFKRRK